MFRTRLSVSFAFGAALAFFASLSTASARQSAGAASQSKGSQSSNTALAAAPAPDVPASQASPQSGPSLKLSDLGWLEGRWRAEWGPRVAEQVWMTPKAGMMLGDFRLIENDKVLVLEFFSLEEKTGGVNFYLRHFTPELAPWEKSAATLLNLSTADGKRFAFENPANGNPKRIVFTRIDADTYTAHSEVLPENGDLQTIEITYHRQPLAAIAPNAAAGAHPKKK